MRGESPRQTVFADYVGVLSALNQKQADALIVGVILPKAPTQNW